MAEDIENPEWTATNTGPLDHAAKLKVVRARLRMSQGDFSDMLKIPVATLRNWEQRRTMPDAPARALIDLIYQDPQEIRSRIETAA